MSPIEVPRYCPLPSDAQVFEPQPTSDSCDNEMGSRVIDIRRDKSENNLTSSILDGLNTATGQEKRLPTLLLYDENGLKLFEKITYLDEYYPTNTEIQILENQADEIVQTLQSCSMLVELGSGNLRKTSILLKRFDQLGKPFEYYALDLDLNELHRTLSLIPKNTYRNVKCFGLHGTYDDGLEYLQRPSIASQNKTIMSLGSSLGNFERSDAVAFVQSYLDVLLPSDFLLLALDGCKDPEKVYRAYNDSQGVTHDFILNGLARANKLLGYNAFDREVWEVIGEYDRVAGKHHAFVSPTKNTTVGNILLRAGERIKIEESYKYGPEDCLRLWQAANVRCINSVHSSDGTYGIHMLAKQPFRFPLDPQAYASNPIPSREEWDGIWRTWDCVSRHMIPDEELLSKPIKLRNACIFYLGHIPTFLDMKLAESSDGVSTEPKYYTQIFERGIDPDVDNPENCHNHSETPNSWPSVEDILVFQRKVRSRVQSLYDTEAYRDPKIARALWLGYEHEAMHLETLLYMLVQSEKTLPPSGVATPDFQQSARDAKLLRVPNEWFEVPAATVVLGLNDPEEPASADRFFGWDIEKPERTVHVPTFRAKARPITIAEYAEYLEKTGQSKLPAIWTDTQTEFDKHTNGMSDESPFLYGKSIRTVWGLVPLTLVQDWPVSASYDELSAFAKWMGGRIPTFEEARSIYSHAAQRKLQANQALCNQIPAVNAHLNNSGVGESPPTQALPSSGTGPSPDALFIDLQGANVGFQHWTPQPVSQKGNQLCGQGDFGGVWEWTSTPLRRHEGYKPMELYPAYSNDFFDEKHNVILGGSWATVPRIAGRSSFVNWYQRNYPYIWAGARLVQDI